MDENNKHSTHSTKDNKDILLRWLDGDISDTELESFKQSNDYSDFQKIIETTEEMSVPSIEEVALFSKIVKRTSASQKVSTLQTNVFPLWGIISTVAAIAVMVFMFTILLPDGISVESNSTDSVSHILPDRSSVILNTNSQLTYDNDFESNRVLDLQGEAFFDVQKGESFFIQTPYGDVTVLGTSFNVFAREGIFTVTCKTGKVQVKSGTLNYILFQGERIRIDNNNTNGKEKIDTSTIKNWTNSESYFEKTPLKDVVISLSNRYNIKIDLPSKYEHKIYTGSFVHNNRKKAIKMVLLPMAISYRLDNFGNILIK